MKNYPATRFEESYIIQLPQSVKNDTSLNWTDRIAYWFFVHFEGDNEKVRAELNMTDRQFRRIKFRLAASGHISRVEDRGQVKYIPLDVDTSAFLKIQQLKAASHVGLKLIPDANIYALKKFHTLPYILHVLEVIEYTYRNSNQKIKKPHHLLTAKVKTGVTAPEGYTPGFWENVTKEPEAKKEREKTDALRDWTDHKAALANIQKIRKRLEGNA